MAKADAPKKRRGKASVGKDGTVGFEGGGAAAPAFDAGRVAERFGLWWESGGGDNYLVRTGGSWASWNKTAVVDLMRRDVGIRLKPRVGEYVSEVQQVFTWVRENRVVDVVTTALAGYAAGDHDIEGKRVLVRNSARLIEAKEGTWDFVRELIEGWMDLRKDEEEMHKYDQTEYFHGWMQTAVRALYAGPGHFQPGQLLVLAGAASVGKNRIQENIITPLLGGRKADPGPYLFGKTDFNSELVESEVLLMADPATSTAMKDRIKFGEMLKGLMVNESQRLHGKRKDAVTVTPFWRITLSINDDPDKLRVLPPMEGDDMRAKIHLFRIGAGAKPLLAKTPEERPVWRDRVARELPAYLWWLLNVFKIPADKVDEDGRMGVRHWHHPGLALELFEDTPAAELLALIDAATFSLPEGGPDRKLWEVPSKAPKETPKDVAFRAGEGGTWWQDVAWEGGASDLELLMLNRTQWVCSVEPQMKKLSMHNNVPRMLGRLRMDRPGRVWSHRLNDERRVVIGAPGAGK